MARARTKTKAGTGASTAKGLGDWLAGGRVWRRRVLGHKHLPAFLDPPLASLPEDFQGLAKPEESYGILVKRTHNNISYVCMRKKKTRWHSSSHLKRERAQRGG